MTDVLAAVVRDAPDLSAAPPSIRRVLEKCLEKDPRKRLRDISGVSLLLDETAADRVASAGQRERWSVTNVTRIAAARSSSRRWRRLAAFYWLGRSGTGDPESIEFASLRTTRYQAAQHALGSRGCSRWAAHRVQHRAAVHDGTQRSTDTVPSLWVRSLGSSDVRPLRGTEGATGPIWAPDSKSIAFLVGAQADASEIGGGTPIKIADLTAVEPI